MSKVSIKYSSHAYSHYVSQYRDSQEGENYYYSERTPELGLSYSNGRQQGEANNLIFTVSD